MIKSWWHLSTYAKITTIYTRAESARRAGFANRETGLTRILSVSLVYAEGLVTACMASISILALFTLRDTMIYFIRFTSAFPFREWTPTQFKPGQQSSFLSHEKHFLEQPGNICDPKFWATVWCTPMQRHKATSMWTSPNFTFLVRASMKVQSLLSQW